MAFNSDGELYIATGGYGDKRIQRVKLLGTSDTFTTIQENPVALAFDLNGNILLTGA
jgi:hypothetical protein